LIILIPCYHQNLIGDFAKHPLFQQGATLCFGKKSISRNWERLAKPKEIIVADKSKHPIWFNLRDVSIEIEGYKFFIPTIYLHDSELDLIIGNDFLKLYEPFTQRRDTISLHWKDLGNPKNSKMVTTKIVTRNEILNLIKGNLKELRIMWEERNFHISIEERLDEVCSDIVLLKS